MVRDVVRPDFGAFRFCRLQPAAKTAALLCAFLLVAPTPAQSLWQPSAAKAYQVAAEKRKPILIVFHAEWCGPCKAMEKDVFTDRKVKGLLSQVVGVRLDVDKSPPEAAQYQVSSIPRMVLLSPDRKTVLWDGMGYRDAATFSGELAEALHMPIPAGGPIPAATEPPALTATRSALEANKWAAFKAAKPDAAKQGLRLLVEGLGVFEGEEFTPAATLILKAGRDAYPALLDGMAHKHLAVRAGAYRALLTGLGNKAKNPPFDPWAAASIRANQLVAWRSWLAKSSLLSA
jgi:thiol-disulfide isomerase/thioredoxin